MKAYFEIERENNEELSVFESINNCISPHFHSNIEIVYVLDGEMTVTINGITRILKKGDVSVCSNYAIHSYDTESFSKVIVLVFPLSMVKSFSILLDTHTFSDNFLLSHPCQNEISSYMKKIVDTLDKENSLKIKGYLYIILSLLIDNIGLSEIKNDSVNFLPKEILIYLQMHYLEPITLSDISEKFNYSKYYFSRFFNTYFKCGFNDYLNTLRSRHAAKLLSDSKMGVLDICYSSGFENQRTFNRAFHKTFHMTPSNYRRRLPG
ncbi:MAG: transcriptional regulator, AraC family [Oscillospiraceae bacterium]|jgi:YesN/AraC family two-component response regulator|nr:transcriptional regulator, AraC family [Oscillospiraceae bacterium]